MLVPSLRMLFGAIVWLGAVAYLVHYVKGLRRNLRDLRVSREDYLAAQGEPQAADARRDLMAEVVAFAALGLVALLAAAITVAGLTWFLTQVIGGLRALLK